MTPRTIKKHVHDDERVTRIHLINSFSSIWCGNTSTIYIYTFFFAPTHSLYFNICKSNKKFEIKIVLSTFSPYNTKIHSNSFLNNLLNNNSNMYITILLCAISKSRLSMTNYIYIYNIFERLGMESLQT